MPKKQIVVHTKIKEEKDLDAAEEFAEITKKRKINPIVANSRYGRSEWQVTDIKEEKDDSSDVDTAAEFAEIVEKREINPFIVYDRYGWSEGQAVIDGKKKKKKKRERKNNVIPNCQLFIKCKPPLLASEIKELHPDIVSVKALRQKGKYFVTFPNKTASSKALEDLRKTDLKGHTLRVHEYRVREESDVPFVFGRSMPKSE